MLTGTDLAAILAACGAADEEKLTEFIYRQCYVKGFSEPAPESGPSEDLTPLLRAAHAGQPCRESGWRVAQVLESGAIVARKGGRARRFEPGQYVNLDSPLGSRKDHRIAVFLPKDSTSVQAGYYHLFGEALGDGSDGLRIVRFYWHIRADGAPRLVSLVTGALGRFQIPYQMKLLQWRQSYYRRDAAVLYLQRRYYRAAAMLLANVHEQIAADLAPGVPLFTKRLAHGFALAENPGESFGKARCRIVAQALVKVRDQARSSEPELAEAVDRQFRECGLSPEEPYLNPGSRDKYEFP